MPKYSVYPFSIALLAAITTAPALALEIKTHGITDIRISHAQTSQSYLTAGYGKFTNNDGSSVSIAQLGTETDISFNSRFGAKLVLNGYFQADETALGMTEAYFKYRSLPSANGWRAEAKAGIFYPKISLENNAFAWASINSLNASMINTWVGEEIRLTGAELKLSRLGKLSGHDYDISLTTAAFVNNDPASALLSWHGWTTGSRQAIWGESLAFALPDATQPGGHLAGQARSSQPFAEIDHRLGYQWQIDYRQPSWGALNLGYYDNRAKSHIVSDGQYGWGTQFGYAGAKIKLANNVTLTAQYLQGSNLMQSPDKQDVVNNTYQSGFVMLSKRIDKHRYALRLEEFQVVDRDQTVGDDNNEYGKALTVNYSYRYAKPLFLVAEFNIVKSERPSRAYQNLDVTTTERQIQFAARYFF
ncbi:MAG: hypothetical protein HRU06_07990 [Oceanospirillaceae bacterium]|nr:hypothetical protein [Oceanospirillaceae bacterium]